MEHVRQKMKEIRQKQQRLQKDSLGTTESSSANDKSHYFLALGGVAVGITIAVIFWLAKSIVTTDHINMMAPERAEAIHTGEIKKVIDNIAQLNERMELLTESITKLEAKLTRVTVLSDSISTIEKNYAASSRQQLSGSADSVSTSDMNESDASGVVHTAPETEKAFVPTHRVNARVNLRPSASLNTTPITVLKIGTEVEYLRKADDWYYVNTQLHGKGWCSSDHLSPLLPIQQKTSAN
jgi:hypothetical protein